jgi:Na+/H+ antiporter NhaD/arsenite permease-like protein
VMFAVLGMDPNMAPGLEGDAEHAMDVFQWLLITLTAGVGGSLLSVGSAAGVALMGTAHGKYTFASHLKWMPVILVGYAASIYTHHLMNYPG